MPFAKPSLNRCSGGGASRAPLTENSRLCACPLAGKSGVSAGFAVSFSVLALINRCCFGMTPRVGHSRLLFASLPCLFLGAGIGLQGNPGRGTNAGLQKRALQGTSVVAWKTLCFGASQQWPAIHAGGGRGSLKGRGVSRTPSRPFKENCWRTQRRQCEAHPGQTGPPDLHSEHVHLQFCSTRGLGNPFAL